MAKSNAAQGCAGLVALIVMGAVAFSFFSSSDKDTAKTPDNEMATFVCGDFVKQHLRDPDSADFITDTLHTAALKQPDGSYLAFIKLRANNMMGGKTISTFSCAVAHEGDSWKERGVSEISAE